MGVVVLFLCMAIKKILLKSVNMLFSQYLNLSSNIFKCNVYSTEQAWFDRGGSTDQGGCGGQSELTDRVLDVVHSP